MNLRSFASDNYSGAHPEILSALIEANQGHQSSYGNDPITKAAETELQKHFGKNARVFFVCNGTAANVLSLSGMTKSYEAIVCSDCAHIHVDECGAIENFGGNKLILIPSINGKLTVEALEKNLVSRGDVHQVQPKVLSLTQSTELGTVYSIQELKDLAAFARSKKLFLQVDGARLANAAASLNTSLAELTTEVGVDAVSFGGTKNGLLFGEAVILLNEEIAPNFNFIRKQGMQLLSKMRFISAQFLALMQKNLWLENAKNANTMAQRLAQGIRSIPKVRITRPVEANAVFVEVPRHWIEKLQKQSFFYIWNEKTCEARWMTSFDTSAQDIDKFLEAVSRLAAQDDHNF